MSSAIESVGLSKSFGDIRAVRDLTLEVPSGIMFALVGPDGAGKTTTIRMFCGLLQPTSGSVKIQGHDLAVDRGRVLRDIGYLSQRFSLYGDLSVDENIEFFARLHKVAEFKKRREELLNFTRLEPFRHRLAERLSGGMRQKLSLACTLIHTPRVLFLDEPTTGVDPVSRRDFWKILSNLLKTGITIVMTTPYLDEAERCSRVGLIHEGKLVVADTPQALKSRLHGAVIELVCTEIRRAFAVLKAAPEATEVQLFGDRLNLVVQDPEHDAPALEARLAREGIEILDKRIIRPSLENVFISLTQ
jgi:ABC-2 type transport system ATP-binding protein